MFLEHLELTETVIKHWVHHSHYKFKMYLQTIEFLIIFLLDT